MTDEKPKNLPLRALRWLIYGQPLATQQYDLMCLRKLLALPVFCSDAISSVAYGPQQIVLTLCLAGLWAPQYSEIFNHHVSLIASLIVLVLLLVAISYWQTIFAYPGGGGSYIVTKDNLGTWPGLIAAAALLIDYVLCVSVSIASGIQNLKDVPLLSGLHIENHLVLYCMAGIAFMTWLNLRGLRTPGLLFAIPVYTFIVMAYFMLILGLGADFFGWPLHKEYINQMVPPQAQTNLAHTLTGVIGPVGLAVLLRAFATGCSALTGIECVSNGIPAFKEPRPKNAALTLIYMAIILGTIFIGISMLSSKLHVIYWEHDGISAAAVIDQISGAIFSKSGSFSVFYNLTQFATAAILFVAAQTAFADFPRVTSILAKDGFMPRQLTQLGDRLAFDNGIMALGVLSTIFIVAKKGSVDLLIPFFTIGVFLAFTMSQIGMVRHWLKQKGNNWQLKLLINGIGALATFIVLIDIVIEKFLDGAWLVLVLMAILLFLFHTISSHYKNLALKLTITPESLSNIPHKNTVLVLVQGVHAGTVKSIDYARSLCNNCQAIYVETNPDNTADLKKKWQQYFPDVPLVVLPSPYRSLIQPIMCYLDEFHKEHPDQTITVVIGEFVPNKWWQSLLHGNTGLLLKLAFLARNDVIVTDVRYSV